MIHNNWSSQIQFIMAGLVLIGVCIWSFRKSKRKTKDIYGFHLEGWSVLKDDNLLYEIESLFKHGFIGQYLDLSQSNIIDWHSNLINTDQKQITGFMQLRKTTPVLVPNSNYNSNSSDNNLLNVGFAFSDGCAKRFYLFKKESKTTTTQILSSVETVGCNEAILQEIKPLLGELEQSFGFKKWCLLNYETYTVVLVDEIFDRNLLIRFLDISKQLTQKLTTK